MWCANGVSPAWIKPRSAARAINTSGRYPSFGFGADRFCIGQSGALALRVSGSGLGMPGERFGQRVLGHLDMHHAPVVGGSGFGRGVEAEGVHKDDVGWCGCVVWMNVVALRPPSLCESKEGTGEGIGGHPTDGACLSCA